MNTKTEAQTRITAAETACEKAITSWRGAVSALGENVSVNGYGIIHDRHAFRMKLHEANARIAASLAALDQVEDWPSSADYDQL